MDHGPMHLRRRRSLRGLWQSKQRSKKICVSPNQRCFLAKTVEQMQTNESCQARHGLQDKSTP